MSYSGKWKTTQYPAIFANGKVWVNVEKKKADFTLQYQGTYQHGLVRKLTATIEGKKGSASGAIFHVKSASNQSISFTADHWTDDEIKGTYQCRNPDDQGTFEVKLQPEGSKEPPEARNGGCVIL